MRGAVLVLALVAMGTAPAFAQQQSRENRDVPWFQAHPQVLDETLRRCHAHLEEGGALLVNIQAEYTSPEAWGLWLSENRKALPQSWPQKGNGRIASDGSEHFGQFRILAIDPLEQTYTRQVRLEKWHSGKLLASEEYTLRGRTYFRDELLLMLQIAGFREIGVRGDYTDEPATADHAELVFIAIK